MSSGEARDLSLPPTVVGAHPAPGALALPGLAELDRVRNCLFAGDRTGVTAALGMAARSLGALAATVSDQRSAVLTTAAAEAPEVWAAEAPQLVAEAQIYNNYFGLLHTKRGSGVDVAASAVEVLAVLLFDLVIAPAVLDDLLALLNLIDLVLAPIATAARAPSVSEIDHARAMLRLSPLGRWKGFHRLYAFAGRAAAAELGEARQRFEAGECEQAGEAVRGRRPSCEQ